jgi:cysteine desulfuration protein SufE
MDINELIDNFDFLGDWEERFGYLMELGRDLEPLADAEKTEASKVRGCVSQVWMVGEARDGRLYFRGDSDAHIVKGLIAVVLIALSGKTPVEILAVDVQAVFVKLGLDSHLSPNRRNGFASMVTRIRAHAESAIATV